MRALVIATVNSKKIFDITMMAIGLLVGIVTVMYLVVTYVIPFMMRISSTEAACAGVFVTAVMVPALALIIAANRRNVRKFGNPLDQS